MEKEPSVDVFRSPEILRTVTGPDRFRSQVYWRATRTQGRGAPGGAGGLPTLHGGTPYPGHGLLPTGPDIIPASRTAPTLRKGGAAGTGHTVLGAQGALPTSPGTAAAVKG